MEPATEETTPPSPTRSRWIIMAVALQIITLAALIFVYTASQRAAPPKENPAPTQPRDDKELVSLQHTIDELNARLKTLEQKPTEPSPAKDIDALHQSIASLEEQIASQSGQQSALVQQLLAFDQLQAAVTQGRPYDTALDAFIASGASLNELSILERHQHKGIASAENLKTEFNAALKHYFHPSSHKNQSVWQRISSLITIRKVGNEHHGDDAQSIIARAESAINHHQLDVAMEEIRSLPEADQSAFSTWLNHAETRVKAMRALIEIKQSLNTSAELADD